MIAGDVQCFLFRPDIGPVAAAEFDDDGLDASLQVILGNVLFTFPTGQNPAFTEAGHDDVGVLGSIIDDPGHHILRFPEQGPQVGIEGNAHAFAVSPHHEGVNRFPARFRQGQGDARHMKVIDAGPVDTG